MAGLWRHVTSRTGRRCVVTTGQSVKSIVVLMMMLLLLLMVLLMWVMLMVLLVVRVSSTEARTVLTKTNVSLGWSLG